MYSFKFASFLDFTFGQYYFLISFSFASHSFSFIFLSRTSCVFCWLPPRLYISQFFLLIDTEILRWLKLWLLWLRVFFVFFSGVFGNMKEEIKDVEMLPDWSNASRAKYELPCKLLTGVDELMSSAVFLGKFGFCGVERPPSDSLFLLHYCQTDRRHIF